MASGIRIGVRPYRHERVAKLEEQGFNKLEIKQAIVREDLEYAIQDIEDIDDVRNVLTEILKHVRIK